MLSRLGTLRGSTRFESADWSGGNVRNPNTCRVHGCDNVLHDPRAQCCNEHKYLWRAVQYKVKKLLKHKRKRHTEVLVALVVVTLTQQSEL